MGEYIKQLIELYSFKYQILNFMVVGGIGYIVNMGLYSLLILLPALKTWDINKLLGEGKPNYLPPFILSSLVAIVCNYLMNRASTFKGWKEQKGGFGRYLVMALGTLVLDTALLWVFVRFGNLPPVPAAALAILIAFGVRYIIARSWVWKQQAPKKN
jgi:putative flippase GtrA